MVWYVIIASFWALAAVYVIGLVMGVVTFEKKEDSTITIKEQQNEEQAQFDSEREGVLRQAS